MQPTSMILMSDFYKQAHAEQYPKGITKLISYATARMTRIEGDNELTVFGVQSFCKDFLIERFNDTFFNIPIEKALEDYTLIMDETFPMQYVDIEKFEKLHKLGYLPIEISCLTEGTRVPIRSAYELPEGECQVPFMSIKNTHPDFPWVTEFLESIISSEVWYVMCIANQAFRYRQIVNEWYSKTGCAEGTEKNAVAEFGFRGGEGSAAATLASVAFLTSFNKTATIPAIKYIMDYYNGDIKNGNIASGMISTEHSVMCSNRAVDKDEEATFLRRLFTEIYTSGTVSVVCDSWDYWNCVENIIGKKLHDEVMQREGTIFVRGDSGDPADIICGEKYLCVNDISETHRLKDGDIFTIQGKDNKYFIHRVHSDSKISFEEIEKPVEAKGTVELLWGLFGGTVNKGGYKVLDKHVRAIYGDSITPTRAREIYKRLADKGFAACNVALGAGSFSTQCLELENGELSPFTRDTYGIAVKATYCRHKSGAEYEIFKDPVTDTGKFKKSQRGLIYVTRNEAGDIIAKDRYTEDSLPKDGNLLQPVFRNGKIVKEVSIDEIRNRLHNNKF